MFVTKMQVHPKVHIGNTLNHHTTVQNESSDTASKISNNLV